MSAQALPEDVWSPLRLLEGGQLPQLQYQPVIRAVHAQQAFVDDAVERLPAEALRGVSAEAIRWAISVWASAAAHWTSVRLAADPLPTC